jgi:UDP-3-O-[3-hydroxymyristoyl] glucosamine N-acyltransferase
MDYKIHKGVTFKNLISIGSFTTIGADGAIRRCDDWCGTVDVGEDVIIGANVTIAKGKTGATVIGDRTLVMNQALVGHNVEIGNDCEIGGGVRIAGHAVIGNGVKIKTGAVIRNRVKIADGVIIGMGAVVVKDIDEPNTVWYGNPATKR